MSSRFEYEFRQFSFGPRASRSEIRQALTDQAEQGDWELVRSALYLGGVRRVTVRRRMIRVQRTA